MDIPDTLATPPYHPLLSANPQGYIPYRHRAAVCKFELDVLPLLVHVKGPQHCIIYELVPASPAMSCMSGSSNFDSFRDEW